jgi:hypothetical protein
MDKFTGRGAFFKNFLLQTHGVEVVEEVVYKRLNLFEENWADTPVPCGPEFEFEELV